MAIALLFFSAWSGFMFCMALTMQEGLGMAPWQSGNSFIALGVAYFISALYAPRLIARYSMGRILLTGLTVQIAGLLLLCATFSRFGIATTALTLVPATALIGYGQALIVNSFYRIGMRDISASDAGAGSAILSTLQQATLGLGPAILGSLFLALARRGGGNYPQALIDFLLVEVAMMLLLGPSRCGCAIISTDSRRRRRRNTGGGNLHNRYPAVIIPAGYSGDVMQELISQIAALGIEITPTRSLMIIFGIILFTAVVVHLILHKVVLRAFEKRALASSHLWLQIITQNKLFHRLAFTLQGSSLTCRRCCGCKKAARPRKY